MKTFLKSILKKYAGTVFINNNRPRISNPTITRDNACETVFEGIYNIPEGTTGTIIGTVIDGFLGGGTSGNNGVFTHVGTIIKTEGIYPYTVDLGNSNNSGNPTSYTLTINLSNGNTITKLFERTAVNSSLYDTQPC